VPEAPAGTEVIEHEIRVAASPETLFAYFTDPAKLVEWMGSEATVDPRPGGVFRLVFQPALLPSESAVLGEYVEVEPYSRVVFSWGWELELLAVPPQSTEVEVSLTPEGESTVVRLVHRRLPAASVDFHRFGWSHYLARLGVTAAGGDPGPDALERPVPA
jgi:uncharacterized protein YndB with AHSA1/START domain